MTLRQELSKLLSIVNKDHKGFTLIELLVGLAITGAIGGGIVTTIIQTNDTVIRNRNHLDCVIRVHQAGYWIQVDTKAARTVELDPGDTGLPVTLNWYDWEDREFEVTYDVVADELQRNLSINGSEVSTMTIASSVVSGSPSTSCRFVDTDAPPDGMGDVLVFTLTVTEGSAQNQKTETRIFKFEPKAG